MKTLANEAKRLAIKAGFDVLIDEAKTGSCYVTIGSRNGNGFMTAGTLRIADHPKPGWSRGGWLKMNKPYYDLRPRSRAANTAHIQGFIKRLTATS